MIDMGLGVGYSEQLSWLHASKGRVSRVWCVHLMRIHTFNSSVLRQGPACDAKAVKVAKLNGALLTRNGSETNLGLARC